MEQLGGDILTIIPRPGRDRFGDPAPGAPPFDVEGCNLQDQSSEETDRGERQVVVDARAFLPSGTPVSSRDQVRHGTDVYEVHGRPAHHRDLDGNPHHVEVRLRSVEGV